MLRINLATRPFYNERPIYLCLGLLVLLGFSFIINGGLEIVKMSRLRTVFDNRMAENDHERAELSRRSVELNLAIDSTLFESLDNATGEATSLVERRLFSWTELFDRLEVLIPENVRLTEVRPEIVDGVVSVSLGVVGRSRDDIREFVEALQRAEAFSMVLNRQVELTGESMYRGLIEGLYLQPMSSSMGEAEERSGSRPSLPEQGAPALLGETPLR